MLAAIHNEGDRNIVAALYESATYFDGVRYYLKSGITQQEQQAAWDILLAAGVLTSQFLVEADEIFLHGKVYADHLETESVQAFIIDTLQLTAYEAAITQLISDRIDVSLLDVTQMANIENLVVAQVLVDADGDPETGFSLEISQAVGIRATYDGEVLLSIDPLTGNAVFAGTLDGADGSFRGSLDVGAIYTKRGSTQNLSNTWYNNTLVRTIYNWIAAQGYADNTTYTVHPDSHYGAQVLTAIRKRYTYVAPSGTWYLDFYRNNETSPYLTVSGTYDYDWEQWVMSPEDADIDATLYLKIVIGGDILRLFNFPTSPTGLVSGRVWKDGNGFLRIV